MRLSTLGLLALGASLEAARRRLARMSRMPKNSDDSPGDRLARTWTAESLAAHYADDKQMAATVAWRIERLMSAGFDELRASTIAATDADWRQAVALVEQGCDPVVAADIVL